MNALIIGGALVVIAGGWASYEVRASRRDGHPIASVTEGYGLLVPALLFVAAVGALLAIGGAVSLLVG